MKHRRLGAEHLAHDQLETERARRRDQPATSGDGRGGVCAEWPALVAHRQASHRGRVKMVGEGGGGRGGVPANDDGRDGKRPSSAPPSLRSVRVSLFVSPARECRPAHERGARARGPGWRERFKSGASPQRGGIASFERAGAPAHGRDIARRLASRTDEGSGPRPAASIKRKLEPKNPSGHERFLRRPLPREQNEQRIASREPHDGILSRISS